MRVILAASALPGLRATQTREVARNAWLSVRPEDHVEAYAVSDGVPQQFVGAGIDEVLLPGAEQIERGGPGERRFAYREEPRWFSITPKSSRVFPVRAT